MDGRRNSLTAKFSTKAKNYNYFANYNKLQDKAKYYGNKKDINGKLQLNVPNKIEII